MTSINDKTKITLGMLIPIIASVAWFIRLEANINAATKDISALQNKQDKVEAMAIDLAVVKAQVVEINRKLDKEMGDQEKF